MTWRFGAYPPPRRPQGPSSAAGSRRLPAALESAQHPVVDSPIDHGLSRHVVPLPRSWTA
ncbi:MAG: hypothetical protein LBE67_03155 [Kocuria palustris]|nr:hypothetical protein [Kocuria palustris]